MVGHLIEQPAKPLDSRWHCLNTLKNAPLTVIINCSWDNKRFVVPVKPQSDSVVDYYDEPSDEGLYGFTTLFTLIKKVKAQIPTIYMVSLQYDACVASIRVKFNLTIICFNQ
jgi:hypothetical protein